MSLDTAKKCIEEKDFEEAIEILRTLSSVGDGDAKILLQSTLKTRAQDVNNLGDKEFALHNYREAMYYYKESVNLIKDVDDPILKEEFNTEYNMAVEKLAQEINDVGDRLLLEKKYKEAMQVYQESVDLIKLSNNQAKYENFLSELNTAKSGHGDEILDEAISNQRLQNWQKAEEFFKKALSLVTEEVNASLYYKIKNSFEKMYAEWAQLINNQGDKAFKGKDYELAIELYDHSVRLAEKSNNAALILNFKKELEAAISGKAEEINETGDDLYKRRQYEKAAIFYLQSINLAAEADNIKLVEKFTKELNRCVEKMAQETNTIGDQEFKSKNYEAAAHHYKKSIEIAVRSKNNRLIENFTNEYEKALKMWALEFVNKGQEYLQSTGYQADVRKKVLYFDRALEIVTKSNNPKVIEIINEKIQEVYEEWAENVNHQGDSHYKNKLYKRAAELYQQSVWLAEISQDNRKIKNYRRELEKALRKME